MKILNRIFVVFLIISVLLLSGCSGRVGNSSTSSGSTDSNGSLTGDSSTSGVSSKLNESLTGLELLKSLNVTPPDSYKVTYNISQYGQGGAKTTTYVKGSNTREERDVKDTSGQPIKMISIYNDKDRCVYEYNEGETTGSSSPFDMMGMPYYHYSMNPQDIKSLMESVNQTANLNPSGTIAKVDTLDGKKVIYIEVTDSTFEDGHTSRIWLSTKYGIPLKLEVYENGNILFTTVVTDISTDPISDSQFKPPSTITLTDYSNAVLGDDGKVIV